MERVADLLSASVAKGEDGFSFLTEGPVDGEVVWGQGRDRLRNCLDNQIFAAWIQPLNIASIEFENGGSSDSDNSVEVIVAAPNKFCCEHVERHYGELISTTLSDVLGQLKTNVSFKVGSSPTRSSLSRVSTQQVLRQPASAVPKQRPSSQQLSYRNTNLNSKYNFSNFVVGNCNQFAHAVALRVSKNLGSNYNPLFIYGGVGLGKTHLANAIGNACHRRGKRVLLASSEVFVTELISALRSNRMPQFREKFRSLDLLIIDDIQFIIGKERTQEEFFHTFNELHNRRKQIIITSDKVPQELVNLEERLRTRFASGVSVDLQAPDFETRVAILNRKAELHGIELPEQAASLIAQKIDTNVRELEGAFNRVLALSSLHDSSISISLTEESLRDLVPEQTQEVTPEAIQNTVAEKFNVSVNDILGKRRTQNIAFARQVAMHLCRRLTGCSYPEIGLLFGGRDHSTVIHANKVVMEKQKSDPALKSEIDSIIQKFSYG